MNAVREKDKARACKLMKDHVLEALDVLLDMYEENDKASEYAFKAVVSD